MKDSYVSYFDTARLKSKSNDKDKKPMTMKEYKWKDFIQKALTTIQLCIIDDVLSEVPLEKTVESLWTKLESLYMTKTIANRLGVLQTSAHASYGKKDANQIPYNGVHLTYHRFEKYG